MPIRSSKFIISRPKLIFWSLLPTLVTLVFYGFLMREAQSQIKFFLDYLFMSWRINQEGVFASVLFFILKLILFLISVVTFSSVSNIVACPFNDFLAEQTEKELPYPLPRVGTLTLAKRARIVGLDLLRSITATALCLVSLLFSWVPLLNALSFIITFLLVSFQFTSYPQTRRGNTILDGFYFLWRYFPPCLGFGMSFAFLFSVPFLSCFCIPLAVVGGTLLVAEARRWENPSPSPSLRLYTKNPANFDH